MLARLAAMSRGARMHAPQAGAAVKAPRAAVPGHTVLSSRPGCARVCVCASSAAGQAPSANVAWVTMLQRTCLRAGRFGCSSKPGLQRCQSRRGRAALAELAEEEETVTQPRLRPVKVMPAQPVPDSISKPPWYNGQAAPRDPPPEVHDAEGIERMRAAGKLAACILTEAGKLCKAGVTTEEIDQLVHKLTIEAGAYPSPLRYGVPPFPKSVCTSVNEVICHGIPDTRKLRDGDIVNVDVTVWLEGYHGDTSRTFLIGSVAPETQRLVSVTKQALDKAVAACAPGVAFQQLGRVIEPFVREQGFAVNKDFIGHGVGRHFHALPWVMPWKNRERMGKMQVGQTFTIEPAVHFGSDEHTLWKDGWTVQAVDGKPNAQFEHTLLIVKGGVEVLTAYE